MQKTWSQAKTEHRLEQSHLEDEVVDAFPDNIPIRPALPAGNMSDDPLHAAPGEVQRDKDCQRKENFLNGT
jgi:hypothetical protein